MINTFDSLTTASTDPEFTALTKLEVLSAIRVGEELSNKVEGDALG